MLKILKKVVVALLIVFVVTALWCVTAFGLGFLLDWLFQIGIPKERLIGFGSIMLIFTLLACIATLICTGVAMMAWGKGRQK